jgi:hypothetical protein
LNRIGLSTNALGHAGATSAGRLAIEQLYGYMCWNSRAFGILTTTTGFAFLRRENGGVLYLSRLYGSHRDLEGYQYQMPASMEDQSTFTISHLLYWFTALTELTPPLPETRLEAAIQVEAGRRADQQLPIHTIVYATPVPTNYSVPAPPPTIGSAPHASHALQPLTDILMMEFKPWLRQNHRGGRAWSALLLPEKMPVVVKCWDAYKNNENARNKEVDIYLRLQELWGICIPRFITFGRVAFCHAIIIEDLEVNSSNVSLTVGHAFVEGQYLHICRR